MAAAAASLPEVAPSCQGSDTLTSHPQELVLSAPGPYGHALIQSSIVATGGLPLEVRLTVPVPDGGTGLNRTRATADVSGDGGKARRPVPLVPVVLHLSGFQCSAAQYAPLAERLATHGYACVQYTLPKFAGVTRIVPDEVELRAVADVWAWARGASGKGGEGGSQGVELDEQRMAVAGHSRGGKLAALLYARQWTTSDGAEQRQQQQQQQQQRRSCPWRRSVEPLAPPPLPPPPAPTLLPRLRALFLADPVDNTAALARRGYPSGVEALRQAASAASSSSSPPPSLALACAGRFGGGNPMGSNWLEFLRVAPAGTRCLLMHNAGHATFLQLPPDGSAGARAIDWLFGGGSAPRPVVMSLSAGFLLAWLRREVLGLVMDEDADAEERRWLAAVVRAGGSGGDPAAGDAGVVQVSAEVKVGGGGGRSEDEGGAEDGVAAQVVRKR